MNLTHSEDITLMNLCVRVKARAIRRYGELLQEMKPAKGANQNIRIGAGTKVGRKAMAEQAGLSKRQKDTALLI